MTKTDLKASARTWVLTNLPYDRSDVALVAEISGLPLHELLVVYRNWSSRHVPARPRTIRKSKAFGANSLVQSFATPLGVIFDDIEKGHDITRYLSRLISIGYESRSKPISRRRHLDLMLNEWGVHHLHLSTTLEPDGFVQRTGPLLFAVFTPDTAYIVDVMDHNGWYDSHVVQVMADEWPNDGIIHEIKGNDQFQVVGLSRQYSDEERAKLRKAGINTLVEFGGRVFMPATGLSCGGTASMATLDAANVVKAIEGFEQRLEADPLFLKPAFEAQNLTYPSDPTFEFAIFPWSGYGVVETKSMTAIPLGGYDPEGWKRR